MRRQKICRTRDLLPWLLWPGVALGQVDEANQVVSAPQDEIVVTATRVPVASVTAPASVDRVDVGQIRAGLPLVDVSEVLNRVPGVVVQNRQNFAQDTQISSRGFGARASFGIRGLKVFVDDIPASIPDGQGQGAIIPLFAVDSIEVLRGPWAVPFGNAAGGVISARTAAPRGPTLEGSFAAGADNTRISTLLAGAGSIDSDGSVTTGIAGRIAAQRFSSDGYRDHSQVVREQTYARLDTGFAGGNRLTLTGNLIHQPDTADPLGLTQAQFDADPRQAPAAAILFNTRKSIKHQQIGFIFDGSTGAGNQGGSINWKLTGYGGSRDVEQFLSTPVAAQSAAGSAGGVVSLARQFHGVGLRLSSSHEHWSWTVGGEMDEASETRRGYENFVTAAAQAPVLGIRGRLRRDELNRQRSLDSYAYLDWAFLAGWKAHVAVRSNNLHFDSRDSYVTAGNGDDSGNRDYRRITPALALVRAISATSNVYASASSGFETPTAAELAYRPDRLTGLNFALAASTNRQFELGYKQRRDAGSINIALFRVETDDEIVPATTTAGRTTFQNGGRTLRQGLEAGGDWRPFGRDCSNDAASCAPTFRAAYTLLRAAFRDGYQVLDTGGRTIVPDALIPGIPRHQFYAEAAWRSTLPGLQAAVEFQARSRIAADDGNTAFAAGYGVVNARVAYRFSWQVPQGSIELLPFARLENVLDRKYVGSVIVNDANLRYYESAPTRRWMAGVSASLKF